MKVGIAGGGIIGSLLAWRASRAGAQVDVFDSGPGFGCSRVGAGLLSSAAETATADPQVGKLAARSLPLWREWLAEIGAGDLLLEGGTILAAAAARDLPELDRTAAAIAAGRPAGAAQPVALTREALAKLEPQLAHLPRAYLLPDDGHLNAERVLASLREAACAAGSSWHDGATVESLAPGELTLAGERRSYDWSCDCRGLGAAGDAPGLRSVRGEIIHLDAKDVAIGRPVRLVHPRTPIYIVPREPGRYLVGATEIESDDASPISVRSALELLSAAYAVQPAFAEARIVEARVGRRPAYPDNVPAVDTRAGYVSINGMYRHGYLAGPALVDAAAEAMGLAA